MSNSTSVKIVMNSVSDMEYIVMEYVVNTVAPKIFLRLKSIAPAINWDVAPKKRTQGIMSDLEELDVNPRSVDASTRVATARPIRPNAAGSAVNIGKAFTVISDLMIFFSAM